MHGAVARALLVDHVVADQVASRRIELGIAGRRVEQALELVADADAGLLELLGRGGDVHGEEAGSQPLDVGGVDRVGEPLAIAQLQEQTPALSPEHLGDHLEGLAVGIVEGEPRVAHHQVGLGAVLVLDPGLAGAREVRRRGERLGPAGAGERSQVARDARGRLVRIHVAHHRHHEVARAHDARLVGAERRRVDARHRLARAEQGTPVGMGPVERAGEEVEGARAQSVLPAGDGGERVAALALDLLGREGRREDHLREQLEDGVEAVGRAVEGEAHAVAAREAVDVRGEGLHAACEVRRRVSGGSAQPGARQEARDPRIVGTLGELSALHRQAQRHDRGLVARQHV